MNIFILSYNPVEAAQMMCDKHAKGGKLLVEACQLLANCYSKEELVNAPKTQTGRVRSHSHYNTPIAKWVRESSRNYEWVIAHAIGLKEEREYRTGSGHFISEFLHWCIDNPPSSFPLQHMTPFIQAMPDICKVPGNAVGAYRKYYNVIKRHEIEMKWTNREIPEWYKNYEN